MKMGNTAVNDTAGNPVSITTITQFDAEQYKGLWYVVAEIPLPDAKCTYSLSTYFPLSEGRMHVTNYCVVGDKVVNVQQGMLLSTSAGTATTLAVVSPRPGQPPMPPVAPASSATNGKLELVADASPDARISYWVYATDYRSYSIVGGGSDSALWILSRTRSISGASMSAYIVRARALGYDTNRIIVKGRAIEDDRR